MDADITIRTYTGRAISQAFAAFQALHVEVFQEWPYLYAGSSSGTPYIDKYTQVPRAALFLASAGGRPIGAATCLPLADESANVRAPFEARGWNLNRFFYFGEGIISRPWRGRGLGVRFFELRESHARACSIAEYTTFCSVRRPADHPLKPADARTNDAFWRNRGYVPLPGVSCTMTWPDIGDAASSPHTLDFWIKALQGAALP